MVPASSCTVKYGYAAFSVTLPPLVTSGVVDPQ
jgi:hypothetical protein